MKEAARKAAEGAEGPAILEATHVFEESVASDILEMSRMQHLVALSSHKETAEDETKRTQEKLGPSIAVVPETRPEKPQDPPAPVSIPQTQKEEEGETDDLLDVTQTKGNMSALGKSRLGKRKKKKKKKG